MLLPAIVVTAVFDSGAFFCEQTGSHCPLMQHHVQQELTDGFLSNAFKRGFRLPYVQAREDSTRTFLPRDLFTVTLDRLNKK